MNDGEVVKDNIILDKSFAFAIRVVRLYKYLCEEKKEYILPKQLLRCGTSIDANVNEAQAAQNKADFVFIKLLTLIVKSSQGIKYGK